jgi:hypothetical protein
MSVSDNAFSHSSSSIFYEAKSFDIIFYKLSKKFGQCGLRFQYLATKDP